MGKLLVIGHASGSNNGLCQRNYTVADIEYLNNYFNTMVLVYRTSEAGLYGTSVSELMVECMGKAIALGGKGKGSVGQIIYNQSLRGTELGLYRLTYTNTDKNGNVYDYRTNNIKYQADLENTAVWRFDPYLVKLKEAIGYTDCSDLITCCVCYAGIELGTSKTYSLTTSSLGKALLLHGFNLIPYNSIELLVNQSAKGDILLWPNGHAVLVMNVNGKVVDYDPSAKAGETSTALSSNERDLTSEYGQFYTVKYNISLNLVSYEYSVEASTKTITYTLDQILYANQTQDLSNTSLLSYPNLVETPFVQLKVNDYVFGTYLKTLNNTVYYPNYVSSMEIKKINGEVNTYTIILVHKIEAGSDPNIVDKILGSVGYGGKVYISYGDYNEPSLTYKEEEAILLSCTSNVDFKNSRIQYTLNCTSNATVLYSRLANFVAVTAKPSDIIKNVLFNSNDTYGLYEVFPAMKNLTFRNKCIASDDCSVYIPAKNAIDPLSYLNYLVTFMCSVDDGPSNTVQKIDTTATTTTTIDITHGALAGNNSVTVTTNASDTINDTSNDNVLKTATYKLCLYDTLLDEEKVEYGIDSSSAYFKIVKISTTDGEKTLSAGNVYEVDVGYPSSGNVMNFLINEDRSWSLLYNYADQYKETVYNIDKEGNLVTEYLPRIAISSSQNIMTESLRTWWTNMTEFPIKATLTLKGLVTPVILMDYVRINALFCGLRHISSGLYVITSQTDSISSAGYRTTLELLRIAGDTAYIRKLEITKNVTIPVTVVGAEKAVNTNKITLSSLGSKIFRTNSVQVQSNLNFYSNSDSDSNDSSYLLISSSTASIPTDIQAFIQDLYKYIRVYAPKYNIKVYSAIIGLAIVESGWPLSKLAYLHHNYFGMKCGSSWKGDFVKYKSDESSNHSGEYTVSSWRVYKSMEGGIRGYFDFINEDSKNGIYLNLKGVTDPIEYAKLIKADGWAKADDYVTAIISKINKYNLTLYDPK